MSTLNKIKPQANINFYDTHDFNASYDIYVFYDFAETAHSGKVYRVPLVPGGRPRCQVVR
jgi:hypothetical protein